MSKQTKMIAIIGGVLILGGLLFLGLGKGGFKGAMQSMGCGGGGDKGKARPAMSLEDTQINDCKALGHVVKRDAQGKATAGNAPDATKSCLKIVGTRCGKDKPFANANQGLCKKYAAPAEDKD